MDKLLPGTFRATVRTVLPLTRFGQTFYALGAEVLEERWPVARSGCEPGLPSPTFTALSGGVFAPEKQRLEESSQKFLKAL